MKRIICLIVALFLSACSHNSFEKSENRIVKTETIDLIEKELKSTDVNTLVIFDCDDVLVTSIDQIMRKPNRKIFSDLYDRILGDTDKLKNLSIVLTSRTYYLVNKNLPHIVNDLQNRNIKTVVLTGFSAAPFYGMKDPRKWRINVLHALGYHFENSWKNLSEKYLNHFYLTYDPCYYKGVIFCGGISKDICLSEFMRHVNIKPDKVIFIDDEIRNLQSIAKFCKDNNIKYIGIEYIEAEKIVGKLPFSRKRAEFQLETLKNKGIWLSDEKAERRLK